MRGSIRLVLAGLVAWGSYSPTARAHESRPLYVEVVEKAPLVFTVRWKIPPSMGRENAPEISLAEGCVLHSEARALGQSSTPLRSYHCEIDPAGTPLRIHYPMFNPSVSALVRVSRLSGQKHSLLASPGQTEVILPEVESFSAVARDYLALGIRHILEGYDHLLFLLCLLLIAGTRRRILITVTGFTLAHSMTLALSALGLVRVPVAPVEAAIALSIVFLAVEIVRGHRNGLTYRYPIAVASSFGLLHGFGFAAVLGEAGLPQTEVPAALLFFNLGVELGQILFLGAALLCYQLFQAISRLTSRQRLSPDALHRLETLAAYAVGILGSFWLIERIATFSAT
ncbi:MAG: hypothetical protein AMJ62_12340 [Myxococcales bacterium SG8_38]|nr:MAG: hypothetical protein AMJ62_12340 [Myxococcales bacterium SG8_38]